MTRWPLLAKAMGKEPITSPRPPVLLHGATSAVTNTRSKSCSACSTCGGPSLAILAFACRQPAAPSSVTTVAPLEPNVGVQIVAEHWQPGQ